MNLPQLWLKLSALSWVQKHFPTSKTHLTIPDVLLKGDYFQTKLLLDYRFFLYLHIKGELILFIALSDLRFFCYSKICLKIVSFELVYL